LDHRCKQERSQRNREAGGKTADIDRLQSRLTLFHQETNAVRPLTRLAGCSPHSADKLHEGTQNLYNNNALNRDNLPDHRRGSAALY